jgi:glycosyltransferase involved in cell wall biosynthesis
LLACIAAIGGKKWRLIISERSAKEELFRKTQTKIYGYLCRYACSIVYNSENAKRIWLRRYPKYKSKLQTVYNTLNLDTNTTTEYVPQKEGKLHLIILASYQYLKNPVGLAKAISLLNEDERSKLKIDWYGRKEVITGDTRAYDEAMQIIKENNLEKTIQLNDETKDVANKINETDVVALFSRVEGLPNAICEGMALGKPIIMTRISDYDVLIDETNGWLCDWNNPESVKDALVAAANTPEEKLLQMGTASKKKARELFDQETVVNQWMKIIEN